MSPWCAARRWRTARLDLDVAASDTTNFLGVVFRAATPRFSNVMFLRPGASGTEEAVQYGPAFNSVGVAWQVYHGEGANAVADLPRNRWMHLRVELDGPVGAALRRYRDDADARRPAAGGVGRRRPGCLGRRVRPRRILLQHPLRRRAKVLRPRSPHRPRPRARFVDWEISACDRGRRLHAGQPFPISPGSPGSRSRAEPEGFVLINRYREAPVGGVPRDSTGAVLTDSVMTGKIAGSRIVLRAHHASRRRTTRSGGCSMPTAMASSST